jgi:hypothetical protein
MHYAVEIEVSCPWCGEPLATMADTSAGDYETVEDCQVCCRPIAFRIICEPGRVESVEVSGPG